MDKATVEAMARRWFAAMDPELEYGERHPEFVADIPQSGERFANRDAMREMQRAFPGPPTIELTRVVGDGDVWVVEAKSDYGGDKYFAVMVVEFRDGLVVRETRYYTQAFEAPDWRAQWVVPIT
jgi:hypothetical protein